MSLGKKCHSDKINFPGPQCLPEYDGGPYTIVSDEAFALHTS